MESLECNRISIVSKKMNQTIVINIFIKKSTVLKSTLNVSQSMKYFVGNWLSTASELFYPSSNKYTKFCDWFGLFIGIAVLFMSNFSIKGFVLFLMFCVFSVSH